MVRRLLRGALEHFGHHVLGATGLLKEELHDGREQLHLHHQGLIVEGVQEGLQELVRIVDSTRLGHFEGPGTVKQGGKRQKSAGKCTEYYPNP